jgi:hypothetical protein
VELTAALATQRPPCVGGGYAAVAGLFSQMLLETPSATMEPANESPPSMVGRGYRWLGEGYRFVTGPSVVNFKRPSDRAPHSSVGPLPCHQGVAEIFPQRAAPVPVKPGWRRRRLSHAWRPGYLAIARVAARGVPGGPVMRPVSGLFRFRPPDGRTSIRHIGVALIPDDETRFAW